MMQQATNAGVQYIIQARIYECGLKKKGTVDSFKETHNHVTTAIKVHICIILQHNCFA
jgi:hypothetical protein